MERCHLFSDLALDVAADRRLPPSDPLLEEAAALCADAVEAHGEHYFEPYQSLARVRTRQDRADEAIEALERGLRKLGHVLERRRIEEDLALARLRAHPRYAAVLRLAVLNQPPAE